LGNPHGGENTAITFSQYRFKPVQQYKALRREYTQEQRKQLRDKISPQDLHHFFFFSFANPNKYKIS